MRIVVCSILLSCLISPSSSARVSEEMHRDLLILCSQVVINDSAQAMIRDLADDCCYLDDRIRDCHLRDWASQLQFRRDGDP
jgi:hypothetical protein